MNNLEGYRILIVEDEALIAEEIKDRLQDMGATIVGIADTAERAIELAESKRPDVALMDIRLKSERDGIDAATEIYTRFNIPAVFLTAYSDRATINRVVNVGQFGYLTKPFREQDLATTISLAHHHHRIEAGLRKSQLSLREIFASSADGLLAADAGEKVRYLNASAGEILGMTAEEAVDRDVEQVLRLRDDESGQPIFGLVALAMRDADARVRDRELLALRPDGSEVPVAVSISPVYDGETLAGAAISLRNLTERRREEEARAKTERALRDQRLLLGTLIDGLPEMFFAVDADQKIIVVNHALLDTFHLRRDEVYGRSLDEIFSRGSLADVGKQAGMAIRTGNRITYQQRAWMAPDGELRWFSFSYMPLANGGEIALACTAVDVTERRELEDELLEATNREQRRLGRDLHDSLGQELASLSLLVTSLERRIATLVPDLLPDTAEIKETIVHAIDSMRATARGLAPADLMNGGLVLALRKLASRCARVRQLKCSFVGSDVDLPPLDPGVAEHIYRFAQEATANAARHAEARTITIKLGRSESSLLLTIEDDGKGFQRIATGKRGGLGLRIMEYRAHKVGGSVDFERPTTGTRVILNIPLAVLSAIRTEGSRQSGSGDAWDELSPLGA